MGEFVQNIDNFFLFMQSTTFKVNNYDMVCYSKALISSVSCLYFIATFGLRILFFAQYILFQGSPSQNV